MAVADGAQVELLFAKRGPGSEDSFSETVLRLQLGSPAKAKCIVTRGNGSRAEAETWSAPL